MIPQARAHFSYSHFIDAFSSKEWEIFFSDHFASEGAAGYPSGRSALRDFLSQAAKIFPAKKRVVMPAYTCPTVMRSIQLAGLEPVLIDMLPDSCVVDTKKAISEISSETLAFISTNLYGFNDNLEPIISVCKDKSVLLIEDCSLSIGNSSSCGVLGMNGDFSFFSTGLGKVITTAGGAISIWKNTVPWYKPPGTTGFPSFLKIAKLFLYPILLSPKFFGLINQNKLTKSEKVTSVISETSDLFSVYQGNLAQILFESLDPILKKRKANSETLYKLIEKSSLENFKLYYEGNNSKTSVSLPSLLRFPVLSADEKDREKKIQFFLDRGIKASRGYPDMEKYLDSDKHPVSIGLCRRLLTLPVHHGLSKYDFSAIEASIQEIS